MADETPMYRVTFEDCFAVSTDVEKEYGCSITWRMGAECVQQKWRYAVTLTAWVPDDEDTPRPVCAAYRTWPARNYGSFPGAILDGLYDLEQRLAAQKALRQLPLPNLGV